MHCLYMYDIVVNSIRVVYKIQISRSTESRKDVSVSRYGISSRRVIGHSGMSLS